MRRQSVSTRYGEPGNRLSVSDCAKCFSSDASRLLHVCEQNRVRGSVHLCDLPQYSHSMMRLRGPYFRFGLAALRFRAALIFC